MQFLNPALLLGLTAASIPLVLHLLNLRKLKTVEFSTLKFLKELQKSKIRRLKLKQLLLLILRTLIIIFTVLAFSRPAIEGSILGLENYAKTSAVIIVDNSFSMDLSDEAGSRFNQAKNAANAILAGLKEGDEESVLSMASHKDKAQYSFSGNSQLLREEISHMKISYSTSDLEASLRIAAILMEDARNINREVYIISDCQSNILNLTQKDSTILFGKRTSLYVIPIGASSKADIVNLSVDSLKVISRIFQVGKPVEVEAILRNSSKSDVKGAVISLIFNGERVAQRSTDIPAGSIRQIAIAAPPQKTGAFKAAIQLENDALDIDNTRHFGFLITEKPTVALVGEQENTRFIELALSGIYSNESADKLTKITPTEFSGINTDKYDVIILATAGISKNDYQRLAQYVSTGGSLMVFAAYNDEQKNTEQFRTGMKSFGFGDLQIKTFQNNQPASFTYVDRQHPIFEGVFKGATDNKTIVESPKIYKMLTAGAGSSIIEAGGGFFLSESRIGEGKILYCACLPNPDWSNFPFTGIFPVITYRGISYLSTGADFSSLMVSGIQNAITLPRKYSGKGSFKITDPSGNELVRQAAILPNGAVLSTEGFELPGAYLINTSDGKPVTVVCVNIAASESILTPIPDNDLIEYLKSHAVEKSIVDIFDYKYDISKNIQRARIGTELWQLCLILALLSAFMEMYVAKNTKADVE